MLVVSKLWFGVIIVAGTSLSACDRQRGDDTEANDPFAARSVAKEDQFGKGFGKAFRADPNSTPRTVSDNDMTPVSLTAEPIVID